MAICLPRTVFLSDQPTMLRGVTVTPQVPFWPAKDPTEVLSYQADFSRLMAAGEVIQSASAASVGEAVTIDAAPTYSGGLLMLTISGGTDGIDAVIVLRVVTSTGETIARSVGLPIVAQQGSALLNSGATYGGGAGSGTPPPGVFVFTQSAPSPVWTIQHDLDRYPNVVVVDSAGDQVEMDVHFVDLNNLTLTAAGALSGVAYLS